MARKKQRMSYEQRKSWVGVAFIAPWIIGFLVFFAKPLLESLFYTFHDLRITENAFDMTFIKLENYRYLLQSDPDYTKTLVSSLVDLAYQVPTIMIFSLIVALVLNQKFIGRTVARAIFFLPVIIASGVVIDILNGDAMSSLIMSGEKTTSLFQVSAFQSMLYEMGLPQQIINFVVSVSNNIFSLSWQSGIQILLFLSGLQTVPPQLYEASSIDGCTPWETFWKITFPMITPVLIVNLIYTITDSFTSYGNKIMVMILDSGKSLKFALSSTMAWIYFAVILLVVGIVYKIADKRAVYY